MYDYHYFGFPFMIFFWGAVIYFIVWLINKQTPQKSKSEDTPIEILNKRYAKGLINKKEFEQMKKDLRD